MLTCFLYLIIKRESIKLIFPIKHEYILYIQKEKERKRGEYHRGVKNFEHYTDLSIVRAIVLIRSYFQV